MKSRFMLAIAAALFTVVLVPSAADARTANDKCELTDRQVTEYRNKISQDLEALPAPLRSELEEARPPRPGSSGELTGEPRSGTSCADAYEAWERANDKYLTALEREQFCQGEDPFGGSDADLETWFELCGGVAMEVQVAADAVNTAWVTLTNACAWLSA